MEGIQIFRNLNEIYNYYGKIMLSKEELEKHGVSHILVKNYGYIRLATVKEEKRVLQYNDVRDIYEEELVRGLKGLYGSNGENRKILTNLCIVKGLDINDIGKTFSVRVFNYTGIYLVVNSEPLLGTIIVPNRYKQLLIEELKE